MTTKGASEVTTLHHPDGDLLVSRSGERATVEVRMKPGRFCPVARFSTTYSDDLLATVLAVKGPASTGDEVLRDQSPHYVQKALEGGIWPFVSPHELAGGRILDFGCGSGASTCLLARMSPSSRIVGVDLNENLLSLASARVSYYGIDDRVTLRRSLEPASLPADIGSFDYVLFSAVYEHLLPNERRPILRMVWECLRPGGVLFINQTPNRRALVEYHTTSGFPLINYLPDSVVHRVVARLSRRQKGRTWSDMLRAGIRGATPDEIMSILNTVATGHSAVRLRPQYGAHNDIEVWYRSTAALSRGGTAVRSATRVAAYVLWPLRRFIIPGIVMAVRKIQSGRAADARRSGGQEEIDERDSLLPPLRDRG
jgi:2-polyprenyl-3-methyl-5-hydroxy-6-metoxy-1,4-benzoquinol methylase